MISIDVAYINNNSVGLLGRFNKNRAKFPKIHGIATLPTRKKIRYFGSRRILALTAVKKYDVIYHATEEIEKALTGLLEPVYEEVVTGNVEVRQVFKLSSGTVAGCYVTNGVVERSNKARVLRNGEEVFNGEIQSLRRVKDEAKEVRSGFECGILLKNFKDIQEGDIIEAYKLEEKEAKL